MTNEFYSGRTLYDGKIVEALRRAADDYENGEILEVKDLLSEIVYAIDLYEGDEGAMRW